MASQRLSIRIPGDLSSTLAALQQATGKSESELVREALVRYVDEQAAGPSCFDLAQQAGLVGCADDLPSDLSTNPRHMKGFGRD